MAVDLDHADVAQDAGIEHFAHGVEGGLEAAVEAQKELAGVLVGGGLEFARLGVREGAGLVEDDVFAGVEGELRLLDVAGAPRGDGNEVHAGIGGELAEVGVTAHVADALRQVFDAFRHDVADGSDDEFILELQQLRDVHEAPGATEPGESDFDDPRHVEIPYV